MDFLASKIQVLGQFHVGISTTSGPDVAFVRRRLFQTYVSIPVKHRRPHDFSIIRRRRCQKDENVESQSKEGERTKGEEEDIIESKR